MRTLLGGIVVMAVALTAVACAGRRPMRGGEVGGLDRKLSTFTFIEEGDLVTLIVNTRATRYRENTDFIPIEFALANHALRSLTLSRESFLLIDEQGRRYHVANPRDLLASYDFLELDRRLNEIPNLVFNRFAAFTRYRSSLSPTRVPPAGAEPATVWERVAVPKSGYIIDMLYFPRPRGGVLNQKFELQLTTTELPHPIFVKFEVL